MNYIVNQMNGQKEVFLMQLDHINLAVIELFKNMQKRFGN